MNIQPLLQTDFYKTSHYRQYPQGTTKIYSNLTPRKSRFPGINSVVFFGLQYFILEYLIDQWNEQFFSKGREDVILRYRRMMDATLGSGAITTEHLRELHKLGYMPLKIKALPEGTLCPIGVPCLTITNTVDHAFWLVNYLETILSCTVWQPITSATLAYEFRKLLTKFALQTTGDASFVQWQGHDFSMRGMSSLESACTSGAGHLLSFTGTDTIPAISFLEQYYGADVEKELVGASVPATEHSVMCMGTKGDEMATFARLLDLYPTGILSVVSDTWDLWKVCTEFLPALKDKILGRYGKLVIRPDSGDPVDIICGDIDHDLDMLIRWWNGMKTIPVEGQFSQVGETSGIYKDGRWQLHPKHKGVVELLWDVFGGTVNDQGYKVLDPHIGAIYGDSISLARAEQICTRLKAKGFASTNIVLGIGSYTYQYNTRDTFGFAVKATYGEVNLGPDEELLAKHGYSTNTIECREIFKDPITDDGTKKSAKGLLRVDWPDNKLMVQDQCSKELEETGALELVFLNGKLVKFQKLSEIRDLLTRELDHNSKFNHIIYESTIG